MTKLKSRRIVARLHSLTMVMIMILMTMLIVSDTTAAAATSTTTFVRGSGSASFVDASSESVNRDASSSINNNDTISNENLHRQHHHLQDRHVASSPLSAAAVCRDGIALISLHYDVDAVLSKSSSSESSSSSLNSSSSVFDPKPGRLMPPSDVAKKGVGAVEAARPFKDDAASASTETVINTNNIIDETESEKFKPRHTAFCDLPLAFRGPLRIETIYENEDRNQNNPRQEHYSSTSPPPMSLLTAGWRADGITLANAGRELMAQEVRVFCLPTLYAPAAAAAAASSFTAFSTISTSDQNDAIMSTKENRKEEGDDGDIRSSRDAVEDVSVIPRLEQHQQRLLLRRRRRTQPTSYHGRRIAEGLSYYLTKCAATESGGIGGGSSAAVGASRPLSCVGLLACGGDGRSAFHDRSEGSSGTLYLIDSTGSYRVRAHAIGDAVRASKLHRRMMHVDFSTMDCNDGLRVMLRLIADLEKEKKGTEEVCAEKEKEDEAISSRENVPPILTNGVSSSSPEDDTETSSVRSDSIAVTNRLALEATRDSLTSMKYQQQEQSGGLTISSKYTAAVELAVLRCGEGRMRRVRLSSLYSHIPPSLIEVV